MSDKMQNLFIKIGIGGEPHYSINTRIKVPRESEYYYIPTDYRNPLRCYLIDYNVHQSVDNIIRIFAVIEIDKKQFEIQPEYLCKTPIQAGELYLNKKPHLEYIVDELNKKDGE